MLFCSFSAVAIGNSKLVKVVIGTMPLAMNSRIEVLKRNIVNLIRRARSVQLIHPMDSGQLVNTSEQPSDSTTPGGQSTAAGMEEGDCEVASVQLPGLTAAADQSVTQEKKKRQFDFSMLVSYSFMSVTNVCITCTVIINFVCC